jgi:hypothetical protein
MAGLAMMERECVGASTGAGWAKKNPALSRVLFFGAP